MQRARRWRRVVKWGLLACAVGVAVLMVGSRWVWPSAYRNDGTTCRNVIFADTVMALRWWPKSSMEVPNTRLELLPPMRYPPGEFRFAWKPEYYGHAMATCLDIPLWFPLLLMLGPYLLLARADRLAAKRDKAHACPACGYDRTGLAAGAVCPECGKVAATAGAA